MLSIPLEIFDFSFPLSLERLMFVSYIFSSLVQGINNVCFCGAYWTKNPQKRDDSMGGGLVSWMVCLCQRTTEFWWSAWRDKTGKTDIAIWAPMNLLFCNIWLNFLLEFLVTFGNCKLFKLIVSSRKTIKL